MAVYKHTFKVTVLSHDKKLDRFESLEDIDYAITHDDCIGALEHQRTERVLKRNIEDELKAIGNDGTFFDPV